MLVAVNHTTRKINLLSGIPRNFDRKYWFYVNTFVPNAPFLYPSKTYNRFLMFSGGRAGGSRTIAPEKNMPSTPKLTLTQTLTLTREQFSSRTIVWLPLNPKTNPNVDPDPNPNRGSIFFGGNCPDTEQGCIGNKEGKTWVWKNLSYSEIRL